MHSPAPTPLSPPITPKVMPLHYHLSSTLPSIHDHQSQQQDPQELIQLPPIKNFYQSQYQSTPPPLHESPYSPTSSTSDLSPTDFLRRKSTHNVYFQEYESRSNDTVFTLPSPVEIPNHPSTIGPAFHRGGGRIKSTPKRSPSPSTFGTFTMNIFHHSGVPSYVNDTITCSSSSLRQLLNTTNRSADTHTSIYNYYHHRPLSHKKKKRRSTVSSYSLTPSSQEFHPYHRHSSPQTHRHHTHQQHDEQQESSQQQQQPIFDTISILNTERHVKKSKTDAAAAYDQVDINVSDEEAFKDDPRWIPNMNAFNQASPVQVVWKGTPLNIQSMPYYNLLHPGEVNIASTLRLTPEQYLKCRRALILAAREFDKLHVNFRKSDAQKCVRIDVNKTSTLWGAFKRLGWFNPPPATTNH